MEVNYSAIIQLQEGKKEYLAQILQGEAEVYVSQILWQWRWIYNLYNLGKEEDIVKKLLSYWGGFGQEESVWKEPVK